MADLQDYQVHARVGKLTDPADRTSAPNETAGNFYWIPFNLGGFGLKGSKEDQALDTEHKDAGARYRLFTRRNATTRTMTTNVWPDFAGFLFDFATGINTSTNHPDFHYAQQMILDAAGTADVIEGGTSTTGSLLTGVVGGRVSFSIDKTGSNPFELSLECLVNADQNTNQTGITPTWPASNPYVPSDIFVDVRLSDATGSFSGTSWTGGSELVRTLQIDFNQNLTPTNFNPNTDDDLHRTWSKLNRGQPELSIQLQMTVGTIELLNIHRARTFRKLGLRLMGVGPNPSGNTTADVGITTSDSTITVAEMSGFEQGDVCIIQDNNPATPTQQVMTIATGGVGGGATGSGAGILTFTENFLIDQDGSGGNLDLEVQNQAFEVKIPEASIGDVGPLTPADGVRVIDIPCTAVVSPGFSELLTTQAYNDDGA